MTKGYFCHLYDIVCNYQQYIVSFRHKTRMCQTGLTNGRTDRQNYDLQDRAGVAASCGKNWTLLLVTVDSQSLNICVSVLGVTTTTSTASSTSTASTTLPASTTPGMQHCKDHCYKFFTMINSSQKRLWRVEYLFSSPQLRCSYVSWLRM